MENKTQIPSEQQHEETDNTLGDATKQLAWYRSTYDDAGLLTHLSRIVARWNEGMLCDEDIQKAHVAVKVVQRGLKTQPSVSLSEKSGVAETAVQEKDTREIIDRAIWQLRHGYTASAEEILSSIPASVVHPDTKNQSLGDKDGARK